MFYLPLVGIISVPRLISLMSRRHGSGIGVRYVRKVAMEKMEEKATVA